MYIEKISKLKYGSEKCHTHILEEANMDVDQLAKAGVNRESDLLQAFNPRVQISELN